MVADPERLIDPKFVMPAELGAAMPARGSGVLVWPEFVTVALSGLVPEYLMPPDRSRTGAVIDGLNRMKGPTWKMWN